MTEETTPAPKTRKAKAVVPYVVGVWADGKFAPCDLQPESPITNFDEIVRWAIAKFGAHPDQYSFVRKDPRTLSIVEQKTIKGTVA
jgi:hypothetical protein